ncbi:MAG TPA: transcriptional regulator, partial [Shewanella frigidimarina]|nr:transcriptional regulator [Shewanella frigidimarina]
MQGAQSTVDTQSESLNADRSASVDGHPIIVDAFINMYQ